MNTTTSTTQALRRRIMRRVYYSYALSVLVSKSTMRGFAFGVSGALLVHLVSIYNVILNLLAVQLGTLPSYIAHVFLQAARNGEFVTLLAVGVLVFSVLSFRLPTGHGHLPTREVSAV